MRRSGFLPLAYRNASATQSDETIRIAAGDSKVISNGITWNSDQYFRGGKSTDNKNVVAIAGTTDDRLYMKARTSTEPLGSFSYNIPVNSRQTYTVRLHFAELYWGLYAPPGPGRRVFSVSIEGATQLADYDIATEAAPMTAVIKSFTVPVTDGVLNLDFRASVDQPLVSAIEVLGTPVPAPQYTPLTPFSWSDRAPAPQALAEAQGMMVGGKLYVMGGFFNTGEEATQRADVFDPATNRWTRLADVPAKLTHAATVDDGQGNIYLLGGYLGDHPGPSTNQVWKYSIATNTWSAGPSLPEARGAGAAARIGNQIHFFGGAVRTDVSDTVDRSAHVVLDLATNTWSTKAPLPNPRNHLGGVALNGKIYAIGGQRSFRENTENQDQVDVYDPQTDTWSQAAPMPNPRGHISASTFVWNNKIVVAGGSVNGAMFGLASTEVTMYEPQTNAWTRATPLPAARKTPVGGAWNNLLIVATGDGVDASPDPTATNWAGQLR